MVHFIWVVDFRMVGFIPWLDRSLDHHANLSSRNPALILGSWTEEVLNYHLSSPNFSFFHSFETLSYHNNQWNKITLENCSLHFPTQQNISNFPNLCKTRQSQRFAESAVICQFFKAIAPPRCNFFEKNVYKYIPRDFLY